MDYSTTEQFLRALISRTKFYMEAEHESNYEPTLEDLKSANHSRNYTVVNEKIERAKRKRNENEGFVKYEIERRDALISGLFEGDMKKNRGELYENAKRFLAENILSEEEKIIVEYELTFCGINYPDGNFFEPCFFKNIGKPDRFRVHYKDDTNDFFMDMYETEHPRRDFSPKRYGNRDLNEVVWCKEEIWDGLDDDIKKFVEGKEKILEVGFLHQRIYDKIMEANPSIRYYGVDIAVPAVIQARRKGIRAYNCNAWYAIPFEDKLFDGIISSTIKASFLLVNPEMKRVLKHKRQILNFDLQ
jgi:hypothetical protein